MRGFSLDVDVDVMSARWRSVADWCIATARPSDGDPALGVFFRFQVADFDRQLGFFSLCHFVFPSYLFWVFGRCVVSVTPKGN